VPARRLYPIGAAYIYFDCHPRPPRRILTGILKIKIFVVSRIQQQINILFHFVVFCACTPYLPIRTAYIYLPVIPARF
jgi:hypothetical protein